MPRPRPHLRALALMVLILPLAPASRGCHDTDPNAFNKCMSVYYQQGVVTRLNLEFYTQLCREAN